MIFVIFAILASVSSLGFAQNLPSNCLEALNLVQSTQSSPAKWLLKFDSQNRKEWNFIPLQDGRNATEGAHIHELSAFEQNAVQQVLESILSSRGMEMIDYIRSLDELLHKTPDLIGDGFGPEDYGENEYKVAIFGEPGNGHWMFRLQGHHLSVNATFDGDEVVSATPLFLGEYPRIDYLHAQEEHARNLAQLLLARGSGGVNPTAPLPRRIYLLPAADRNKIDESGSVPYSHLTKDEAYLLELIFTGYVGNLTDPVRSHLLGQFKEAKIKSPEQILFYWMGSIAPGEPHHFYIQILPGKGLTLEIQNIDGHHIHSVLRDFANDFGDI